MEKYKFDCPSNPVLYGSPAEHDTWDSRPVSRMGRGWIYTRGILGGLGAILGCTVLRLSVASRAVWVSAKLYFWKEDVIQEPAIGNAI
eukprot:14574353-Ditylum_brightwellii.AAC.1